MDKGNLFLIFMAVLFALTVFPIGVYASPSYNYVPNGSFETGDMTGWTLVHAPAGLNDFEVSTDLNIFTAGEGNFLAGIFADTSGTTQNANICTDSNFIESGKIYDFNIGWGAIGYRASIPDNAKSFEFYIVTDGDVGFAENQPNTDSRKKISNDDGTIHQYNYSNFTMTQTTGSNQDLCFRLRNDGGGTIADYEYYVLDDITYLEESSVSIDISDPSPVGTVEPFEITATVTDLTLGGSLGCNDVNLNMDFDGAGNELMSCSLGTWTYSEAVGLGQGNYSYTITSTGTGYANGSENGSLEVRHSFFGGVAVENIENVHNNISSSGIDIYPISRTDDIIWKTINQDPYGASWDLNYTIHNSDNSGKQYWVYVSTNGADYVLDESLTYGTNNVNGIQKYWDVNDDEFNYTFHSVTSANKSNYYKLTYDEPASYWETIGSSLDWVNQNPSNIIYRSDGEKFYDVFQDSNYSSIRSMTYDFYPELTSVDINTGFYLQFTAYANVDTNLDVGYTYDGNDVTQTVQVGTSPVRYSVLINPDDYDSHLLFLSDGVPNATFYISDYAILPIAYFTKRLEILNEDRSPLGTIFFDGASYRFVREAFPLIFDTSAYNRNNDLDKMLFYALIGETVIYSNEFSIDDGDTSGNVINWDSIINGVVDLNGYYDVNNLFLRDIIFRAVLVNDAGESVSEQTETVKLAQYPFFAGDIISNIYPLNNKVGESPEFNLELTQKLPEHFLGLRVRVFTKDEGIDSPSYDTYIYNKDVQCNLFNCSKRITLDEYVFDEENTFTISVLILLSTENEILGNPFTEKHSTFNVNYRQFETARIFQVFERSDFTYRNDEPIQLVLQLRDVPYRSTKDTAIVSLYMDVCETSDGDDCVKGNTAFYPIKHIFDETTGYNYYYFNNVFYTDSGELFSDANYISPYAYVEDSKFSKSVYDITLPTLASKCKTDTGDFNDIGSFLYNFFEESVYQVSGCTEGASAVIGLGHEEQARILIDDDHVLLGSINQSLICVKYDNTLYKNSVDNDLFCQLIYKRSEKSLDAFKIYVGNENSDYSKKGEDKQYIDFTIPIEQIIFNDPYMMQQALNSKYNTEIDTLGEIFFYTLDDIFTGVANPVTEVPTVLTDSGIVTNVNWDINWDGALDPSVLTGIFAFKIEGLKVINQYPYFEGDEELQLLNPSDFLTYAIRNGIRVDVPKTFVTLYTRDMLEVLKFRVDSPLVINKAPSVQSGEVLDENGSTDFISTRLKFNVISDMLYNNLSSADRVFVPLVVSYIVPNQTNPLLALFRAGEQLISNPLQFVLDRWFWFVIIILFVFIVSMIYRNFKGNGTAITINNAIDPNGSV